MIILNPIVDSLEEFIVTDIPHTIPLRIIADSPASPTRSLYFGSTRKSSSDNLIVDGFGTTLLICLQPIYIETANTHLLKLGLIFLSGLHAVNLQFVGLFRLVTLTEFIELLLTEFRIQILIGFLQVANGLNLNTEFVDISTILHIELIQQIHALLLCEVHILQSLHIRVKSGGLLICLYPCISQSPIQFLLCTGCLFCGVSVVPKGNGDSGNDSGNGTEDIGSHSRVKRFLCHSCCKDGRAKSDKAVHQTTDGIIDTGKHEVLNQLRQNGDNGTYHTPKGNQSTLDGVHIETGFIQGLREIVPILCQILYEADTRRIDKRLFPNVRSTLKQRLSCVLLYDIFLCYSRTFTECLISHIQVIFQHVYLSGHGGHHQVQTGTIRTEILKDRLQGVHVTHLIHLLKYLHDSLHHLTLLEVLIDSTLGKIQVLLNQVVVGLHGRNHLIKCGSRYLRHQSHSVGCRTDSKQLVSCDTGGIGQSHQSLRELDDISTCGSRGCTEFKDGRTSLQHRLLHAQLRNKTHDFHELREFLQGILTQIFFQGHIHHIGSTGELFKSTNTIFTHTKFSTSISQLVQFLNRGAGVNLSQVHSQLVNILHGQS